MQIANARTPVCVFTWVRLSDKQIESLYAYFYFFYNNNNNKNKSVAS